MSSSAIKSGRRGRVVDTSMIPSSSQSSVHTSLLTYVVSRLPMPAHAVSCLCLQVIKPRTKRQGNAHSIRIQSEWHVSMVDGSIVRLQLLTDRVGVNWRARIVGGWPLKKLTACEWRQAVEQQQIWSTVLTQMNGHCVPNKLSAETFAARQYLNDLKVTGNGSHCTVLLFHIQQSNWMDAGPGFCYLRGNELAVRDKTQPSRFIFQQTVAHNTFYQQDGHSLLMFAMGPNGTNEEDQVLAIVFDSRRRIDDIARRLSKKTERPCPNYQVEASPHADAGHVCTRLRVTIQNRHTGERVASGLACFESSSHKLTVWFEYDGHPSNFIRFTHKVKLSDRADYHYLSNGVFTLGASEFQLSSERPSHSSHDGSKARMQHINAEYRLWQAIEESLETQAIRYEERKVAAAATARARQDKAKAQAFDDLIADAEADQVNLAEELAAAAADDEGCQVATSSDLMDDMDLENDEEKDFVLPSPFATSNNDDDDLNASLLWGASSDKQEAITKSLELEPEYPIQQQPRTRPTILTKRRRTATVVAAAATPTSTNVDSDAPTSPTSASSSDDDDFFFDANDEDDCSSTAAATAKISARDRRLCTTPPRVKNNNGGTSSCSRALDAALNCLNSLLP